MLEEQQVKQAQAQEEMQGRQKAMERKDSEVLKGRERMSNLERDLMQVREANK